MILGASFCTARGGLLSYYTHRSRGPFILRVALSRFDEKFVPSRKDRGQFDELSGIMDAMDGRRCRPDKGMLDVSAAD